MPSNCLWTQCRISLYGRGAWGCTLGPRERGSLYRFRYRICQAIELPGLVYISTFSLICLDGYQRLDRTWLAREQRFRDVFRLRHVCRGDYLMVSVSSKQDSRATVRLTMLRTWSVLPRVSSRSCQSEGGPWDDFGWSHTDSIRNRRKTRKG